MRHPSRVFTIALAAMLLGFPDRPLAQAQAQRGFCFRGRPQEQCRWFGIFELTALKSVATTRTEPAPWGGNYEDFASRAHLGVGLMRNVSPTRARGLVFDAGIFTEPGKSVEWRERWWGPRGITALDVGAGYASKSVLIRERNTYRGNSATARGFTASTSVSLGDIVGVTGRADVLFSAGRTHRGIALGVRAGSYGAVTVSVLGAAWIVAVLSSMGG
jgi:hypothetical protein